MRISFDCKQLSFLRGIMNTKQRKFLWVGLIVFLLSGIFPPWVQVFNDGRTYCEKDQGYSFLMNPPEVRFDSATYAMWYKMQFSMKIDITRLVIQWIIILVLFSGIIISLKQK